MNHCSHTRRASWTPTLPGLVPAHRKDAPKIWRELMLFTVSQINCKHLSWASGPCMVQLDTLLSSSIATSTPCPFHTKQLEEPVCNSLSSIFAFSLSICMCISYVTKVLIYPLRAEGIDCTLEERRLFFQ